jgi:hypothetical protein
MSAAEILKTLTKWQEAILAVTTEFSVLEHMFGAAPEGPLPTAIHSLIGAYTHAVSDVLGWDYGTLEDWIYTHNFGERPMEIGFSGQPLRTMKTIEDLAQFIFEDLARNAKESPHG